MAPPIPTCSENISLGIQNSEFCYSETDFYEFYERDQTQLYLLEAQNATDMLWQMACGNFIGKYTIEVDQVNQSSFGEYLPLIPGQDCYIEVFNHTQCEQQNTTWSLLNQTWNCSDIINYTDWNYEFDAIKFEVPASNQTQNATIEPEPCCQQLTAKCLACAFGLNETAYCTKNKEVEGCYEVLNPP